jgi:hypothetical protein
MALLGQLTDSDRATVIVIAAVALPLIAGMIGWHVYRVRPINRGRAASGLPPLRWHQIAGMRAGTADLVADTTGELAAEEIEAQRQREWERHVAAQEMAKYGRAQTRAYCSAHDRWCLRPWLGQHPPGGFDAPRAPDDWVA